MALVFGILVKDRFVGPYFLVAHISSRLFEFFSAGGGKCPVFMGFFPIMSLGEGTIIASDRKFIFSLHQPGVALIEVCLGRVNFGETLHRLFEFPGTIPCHALPDGIIECFSRMVILTSFEKPLPLLILGEPEASPGDASEDGDDGECFHAGISFDVVSRRKVESKSRATSGVIQ